MSAVPKTTAFEVYVSKDTFKFNAAHFVAFKGYRERLHGHNYKIGVRLLGQRQIGADGYVLDFGIIKDVCKKVCKDLNEHFICPIHSNVLDIETKTLDNGSKSVQITCEDGSFFVFPLQDCAMLPLVHATAEELSIYLWGAILRGLQSDYLIKRGIHTMEITVAEAIGQEATFRLEIPSEAGADFVLDVRSYIMEGEVVPMPCLEKEKTASCCTNCQSKESMTQQLDRLAKAINDVAFDQKRDLTANDLQALLLEP